MGHKKSGKIGEKLVFEISRKWTYFSLFVYNKNKKQKGKRNAKIY